MPVLNQGKCGASTLGVRMADVFDVVGPCQASPDQGNSVHHAAPPDDGGQGFFESLPMKLVTRPLAFSEA